MPLQAELASLGGGEPPHDDGGMLVGCGTMYYPPPRSASPHDAHHPHHGGGFDEGGVDFDEDGAEAAAASASGLLPLAPRRTTYAFSTDTTGLFPQMVERFFRHEPDDAFLRELLSNAVDALHVVLHQVGRWLSFVVSCGRLVTTSSVAPVSSARS